MARARRLTTAQLIRLLEVRRGLRADEVEELLAERLGASELPASDGGTICDSLSLPGCERERDQPDGV